VYVHRARGKEKGALFLLAVTCVSGMYVVVCVMCGRVVSGYPRTQQVYL
jgi:hypothetical protein